MQVFSLIREVFSRKASIDWVLLLACFAIVFFGLLTMNAFIGENLFFEKQLISFTVAIVAFFIATQVDTDMLKRTNVLVALFIIVSASLLILFSIGHTAKGAQSWFKIGLFAFQPADAMKLLLILILAKYFSRRHVEIAHFRHIIVSGAYALIPFFLVLLQPDFGSAMIIFLIWLGMILVSGVSKKHLAFVFLVGVVAFGVLWVEVFKPYQKARIMTFIHHMSDIRGSGYINHCCRFRADYGKGCRVWHAVTPAISSRIPNRLYILGICRGMGIRRCANIVWTFCCNYRSYFDDCSCRNDKF